MACNGEPMSHHVDKSPHKIGRIPLESVQILLRMSFAHLLLICIQQLRHPACAELSCKIFSTFSSYMPMASVISQTLLSYRQTQYCAPFLQFPIWLQFLTVLRVGYLRPRLNPATNFLTIEIEGAEFP